MEELPKSTPETDRKVFDDMFSLSVLYNSACVCCANPVQIQPIIMSILFHHYKELGKLKANEESKSILSSQLRKY